MARPHRRGLGEALETDPRAAGFDGAGAGGAGLRDGLADRGVYLDRAAPRLALAKFVALTFTFRPFIEPGPGSNCPGRMVWPGWSALAFRFLAFCAAFAFARWRALALVMSASPFYVG